MRSAVRDGIGLHSRLAIIGALLFQRVLTDAIEPISVTFNQQFIGYDGQWSPAQISVGSPNQWLSLLPSTTESEAWVVGPAGCDGTSTCSSLRGGLFNSESSKTWQGLGLYELGYSALTQNTDNGYYGLDTLALSDSISVPKQIVAVVNDTNHWIGQLGLVVENTRFQNTTNYLPLISSLVQKESLAPSHSYGYTAGAAYKGQGVLGSLTIGGTDTTRYVPNNVSFSLAPGYIPSVAVNSVSLSASSIPQQWTSNPLTVLSSKQAAVFTIDSNTPFLWFPETVCETIAQALNLTWNATIELYTFANNSTPQNLQEQNLQFTFGLANSVGAAEALTLNVSYDAFNLQLSYPFPGLFTSYSDAKVNYFPLRRANSSNQYTIGRAFLQEIYLTVDYERNDFALSQALFPGSSQTAVLSTIPRPKDSTWPGPQNQDGASKLSAGAVAGIAIGAVVVLLVSGILLWWFCIRKRQELQRLEDGEQGQRPSLFSFLSKSLKKRFSTSTMIVELHADKRHPTEMVADSSNSRYELPSEAPIEMAAADVSPIFFQPRVHAHIEQLNDPRTPLELPNPQRRTSTDKSDMEHVAEHPGSPAPAYSPTDPERRSNSVSPYTPIAPDAFSRGSDQAISPVRSSSNGLSEVNGRLHP